MPQKHRVAIKESLNCSEIFYKAKSETEFKTKYKFGQIFLGNSQNKTTKNKFPLEKVTVF